MTRTEKLSLLTNTAATLDDVELENILAMVQHLATGKSVYETAPQHVRDSIERGIADDKAGRVSPLEDVMSALDIKLKAAGV